jgi:hypothetical protein
MDYVEHSNPHVNRVSTVVNTQYCCGLYEFGGFPTTYADTKDKDGNKIVDLFKTLVTHVTSDRAFESDEEEYDEEDNYISLKRTSQMAMFSTLARYQWETFEPMLLNAGFKIVGEFQNPNTDNQVRVYLFTGDL